MYNLNRQKQQDAFLVWLVGSNAFKTSLKKLLPVEGVHICFLSFIFYNLLLRSATAKLQSYLLLLEYAINVLMDENIIVIVVKDFVK